MIANVLEYGPLFLANGVYSLLATGILLDCQIPNVIRSLTLWYLKDALIHSFNSNSGIF